MPRFAEVQKALERCMQAEPVANHELSPDANELSTVFAEMIYSREEQRDLDRFTESQLAAFRRWQV